MPRRWLARVQVVEYLRAFMIGRAGWSATGGLLIISGAFGIFRKDVLVQVGGLATDCIGEDAELVVRIYRWMGDEKIDGRVRSEEHTSELQSLMRISYAVFCLNK